MITMVCWCCLKAFLQFHEIVVGRDEYVLLMGGEFLANSENFIFHVRQHFQVRVLHTLSAYWLGKQQKYPASEQDVGKRKPYF